MKKRLIVLGSTGSIGTKVLEVVHDFPGRFQIVALSANSNTQLLSDQAREFAPKAVCVCDPAKEAQLRSITTATGAVAHVGERGLCELIDRYDADLVVIATVGFVGLRPTLRALERGLSVALANKEALVT